MIRKVIVVDIQGVGDLYTDPQIHTATGEEYGDGNLGTKGMAPKSPKGKSRKKNFGSVISHQYLVISHQSYRYFGFVIKTKVVYLH